MKEFNEFLNPESLDYDIKTSNFENATSIPNVPASLIKKEFDELYASLGFPEDFEVGMSVEEIANPNFASITKLKDYQRKLEDLEQAQPKIK